MTSSLVGSEMCIRDRFFFTQELIIYNWRHATALREAVPPLEMRRLKAVSYTHLTLPTICSV
eukprot:2785221-Prorocentrum_lima.AAC.1